MWKNKCLLFDFRHILLVWKAKFRVISLGVRCYRVRAENLDFYVLYISKDFARESKYIFIIYVHYLFVILCKNIFVRYLYAHSTENSPKIAFLRLALIKFAQKQWIFNFVFINFSIWFEYQWNANSANKKFESQIIWLRK